MQTPSADLRQPDLDAVERGIVEFLSYQDSISLLRNEAPLAQAVCLQKL